MKTFVDFIYGLLIGAAVALFVGLGIWTFYSGPKFPEYPNYAPATLTAPSEAQDKEFQARQDKFDRQTKQYDKDEKSYSKKVAVIALAAAVVFYLAGGLLMRLNGVVGEGLALGGVFTTVYATIRAAITDFKSVVFTSVTLILVMVILLALFRVRLQRPTKTKNA